MRRSLTLVIPKIAGFTPIQGLSFVLLSFYHDRKNNYQIKNVCIILINCKYLTRSMNNKKTGVFILILTLFLLGVFVLVIRSLNQEIEALGCFENAGCRTIETSLSVINFAFGAFGFLFALAFYLLIFSKGEEAIVERLEKDTTRKLSEEKYSILSKGLNEHEKKILNVIRGEEGITQNMLRLRVDLSKAKVSQVLQELEKKELIKREPKDKTFQVFLKERL